MVKFLLFYFRVTNWKLKDKKLHFEVGKYLQLEVGKYLISLQVTISIVKLLFFRFRVTNLSLKNKKLHFKKISPR